MRFDSEAGRVAQELSWRIGKPSSQTLIVSPSSKALSNSKLVPFMPFRKSHFYSCPGCGEVVKYWLGYNDEILAKQKCSCFIETLVETAVRLSQKEKNDIADLIS